MKYFYLALAISSSLFLYQCDLSEKGNKTQCQQDIDFMINYENCLLVLTKARHGFPTDYKDRLKAIECLEAITGKESQIIKHSDVPYLLYRLDENSIEGDMFSFDLKNWITWLSENKCNFRMKDAEAVFLKRSQKLGFDLTWPTPFYDNFSDF